MLGILQRGIWGFCRVILGRYSAYGPFVIFNARDPFHGNMGIVLGCIGFRDPLYFLIRGPLYRDSIGMFWV